MTDIIVLHSFSCAKSRYEAVMYTDPRRGGATPIPPAEHSNPPTPQAFSSATFDDMMRAPQSSSSVVRNPAAKAATKSTGSAAQGGGSLGRKLLSFPWSRTEKKQTAAAQQQRQQQQRLVSNERSGAPKPGPSILKTTGSLPMGFPVPPAETEASDAEETSPVARQNPAVAAVASPDAPQYVQTHPTSNASLSTVNTASSFASTSLFASPSDGSWQSEATTVSLSSSPDSVSKSRDQRRVPKNVTAGSSSSGARPFSVLSDIVERENEDSRASMYDVFSLYSRGGDVPVRRVSTPVPAAVAAMLASEPATPPRQKRWSTSSLQNATPPAGHRAANAEHDGEDADDEVSPPRIERRNSFDSPSRKSTEAAAKLSRGAMRIPSMRFDGISMDAMFAEVEARMNRELAAKQLDKSGSPAKGKTASSPDATAAATAKKARRKSRVQSLQEPLAFEITTPVFGLGASTKGSTTSIRKATMPREATITEEDEEEAPELGLALRRVPMRTSSRPEPVDIRAANTAVRDSPRSAPLQATAPFFPPDEESAAPSPTSPTPLKVNVPTLLLPADIGGEERDDSASIGSGSPQLQGAIPELLVCPPSPPERPRRRAPPPPPLQLRPAKQSSPQSVPFPTHRPVSPAASLASTMSRPISPMSLDGTGAAAIRTDKKMVRLSTRAQTRRVDRPRTFSSPAPARTPSPVTPSTPTFEITPPPPETEPSPEQIEAIVASSQPSTPVQHTAPVFGPVTPPPVSPTLSSTPTFTTAAPYHPPTVLRTDYHPALSNLTVSYPTSDESSSECEESFQDMLIRLNRPHTPPRKTGVAAGKGAAGSRPASADSSPRSLTKTAMDLHNTSHSRLSMLARELGESMLQQKENVAPARRRETPSTSGTDTRRYSKLFAAGEVNLDQFDGAPVLVSQAEPLSPTVKHHSLAIHSEHGHAGETSWNSVPGLPDTELDVPAAVDEENESEHEVEYALDRTIASLISDESKASSSASTTSSRTASHSRTDSDSSVDSLDAAALIVEAKFVAPRKSIGGASTGTVNAAPSGHRSNPSESSIGSSASDSTDTDEGVVCLGERISCSYNVGVIGVAM